MYPENFSWQPNAKKKKKKFYFDFKFMDAEE